MAAVFHIDPESKIKEQEMIICELKEGLVRIRHQSSYRIGSEDALRIQLEKVRNIANEYLKMK